MNPSRRSFLASSTALLTAPLWNTSIVHAAMKTTTNQPVKPLFEISLAQWSLHRMLQSGKLDNLDFPALARKEFDIAAVEYVNSFFKTKARDAKYLDDLNTRAADAGVQQLLIMVDGEGDIGHADPDQRRQSIENHKQWLDAAKHLGCHSIRVNAASSGSRTEQIERAADGLRTLAELAAPLDINVIVENHGGLSSDGTWLSQVMRKVDHPRCGTLPDFGNFCFDWSRAGDPDAWYDRYKGVEELMPFAKAVSAKSHAFDDQGNETATDYRRMLRIVIDAGYRGHVGIEYEGARHSEFDGIRHTKALLETVRSELELSLRNDG